MYLLGTHRSAAARLRLSARRDLGAGNFFWHACAVATDLDRPLLYRREGADLRGYSLWMLRTEVLRYVNWYRAAGLAPGARVGVYTADGLAGLLHHIAVTSLGATTVLTNPGMAPDMAAAYLRRADTTLLVADADLLAAITADNRGQAWSDDAAHRSVSLAAITEAATDSSRPADHPHPSGESDVVLVSHSSGTTGTPKPTSFAHRTFMAGKRERLWRFPSARTDRMVTALPQSHSAGISYLSLAILLGLPTLLADDQSGSALAAAMNAFRPTVVIGFPATLADLPVDDLSEQAAGAVHTWMGMGDASHERHIRPLVRLGRRRVRGGWLPGSTYVDGLGSSEMGMVLFKNAHTMETPRYGRMIGRPVRVVRSAVALNEEGTEVPVGEAGLLGVRTPSVTPGYVNLPDLTDDAIRGGYFLTGDVVRQDGDGNWYHLDRTPDVIQTAAGPVYSLLLEETVLNETGALDAAVVAVADPVAAGSCLPIAVVLFKDNEPRVAADMLRRCNTALARHGLARLAALVVAADRNGLPVGVTGKVLKRVLRQRYRTVLSDPSQDDPAPDRVTVDAGLGMPTGRREARS
jgi:long-chain acyl-CoA synthetase